MTVLLHFQASNNLANSKLKLIPRSLFVIRTIHLPTRSWGETSTSATILGTDKWLYRPNVLRARLLVGGSVGCCCWSATYIYPNSPLDGEQPKILEKMQFKGSKVEKHTSMCKDTQAALSSCFSEAVCLLQVYKLHGTWWCSHWQSFQFHR